MKKYLLVAKFEDTNGMKPVIIESSIIFNVNEDEEFYIEFANQIGGWSVDMGGIGYYFQSLISLKEVE